VAWGGGRDNDNKNSVRKSLDTFSSGCAVLRYCNVHVPRDAKTIHALLGACTEYKILEDKSICPIRRVAPETSSGGNLISGQKKLHNPMHPSMRYYCRHFLVSFN
jgi:hypothetical protein